MWWSGGWKFEDVWSTAPGSANSCHDTVQLADPGRKRLNFTLAARSAQLSVCRPPWLLEQIRCTNGHRSLVRRPGPGAGWVSGPGTRSCVAVVCEGVSAASPVIPRSLMMPPDVVRLRLNPLVGRRNAVLRSRQFGC